MNTVPHAFPTRIGYDEARSIVEHVAGGRRPPSQHVALARAHGMVLAQDVIAQIAQPPFDNAAMDGFAFRHADLDDATSSELRLVGEQFAGRSLGLAISAGECVRITTGAPMPDGADTVVMKEDTELAGDRVRILQLPAKGRHVRRAGEDSLPGDLLLRNGDVLTATRIALAASQGLASLDVAPRPTVAVFASGDELVEPGLPLQPGQIHNSNRELLMGLLRAEGIDPVSMPTLPDDADGIRSALRHAGEAFDLVITCGGVSAGEKDLMPGLLQARGKLHFWKVRLKPGMPTLFAEGDTLGPALFLCLPGNPVSVLATWLALGRPLIDAWQGRPRRPRRFARLRSPWRKTHERMEFLRGRLACDEQGILRVEPNPADGSHRMRAASDSDALILLPEGPGDYPVDAVVEVLPY